MKSPASEDASRTLIVYVITTMRFTSLMLKH